MTYLSHGIQERLQHAFAENNLTLNIRSSYIIAENSKTLTKEKIQKIIRGSGFRPIIPEKKIDGNFVFTITPYKLSDFFRKNTSTIIPGLQSNIGKSLLDLKTIEKNRNFYFKKEELLKLLEQQTFISTDEEVEDRWYRSNNFRSLVSTALSNGIGEVISKHIKHEHPIVEIGSGIGYVLSKSLSTKIIRTQPNQAECQLLSKSISEQIYKMDIEGIYNCLFESGKKIPLFFAVNVFDTLSPSLRKASFLQISQLQNTNDHIFIILDNNPCLEATITHLESLYPEHSILPYYPLTNEPTKFSVIIIPGGKRKISSSELFEVINQESMLAISGQVSELQQELHKLKEKFDLKVISIEDFFVEQVKSELMQAGYQADVYYHASFATGDLPKGFSGKQDLFYKPVTDIATVRQWCLTDERLLKSLSEKGLNLPIHFNEDFLLSLKERGHKIFGAEILVIDAQKN